MKKSARKVTIAAAVIAVAAALGKPQAQAGTFNPGDLVVDRVGSGSAALSNASAAVFLDEFTLSGTAVQSIGLAADGTGVTQSGTATSEGFLHFTADGSALVVPGYNVAAGVTGVASATSTAAPRAIAEFSLAGTQTSVTQLGTAFSGNNIRSATGSSASNLFAAGGNTGIVNATMGTNGSTIVNAAATNNRDVNVFGGNLYFDSASGTTARGLYQITGTSGAAGQTATQVLATGSASSPYGFSVSSDGLTAYIADSTGTLTKYSRGTVTGTFNSVYSIAIASGVTGLTVSYGATNTIYYDNPTTLYADTDSGTAFGTITTLDTAATNTAFRGLDLVPGATAVPEPTTLLGGMILLGAAGWSLRRRSRAA